MLLSAGIVSIATKFSSTFKARQILEPSHSSHDHDDRWLFEISNPTQCQIRKLGKEMGALARSFAGMCETLKSANTIIAFPARPSTHTPYAAQAYDRDLFDGEASLGLPCQDTLIGGASEFLFEKESALEQTQKAA
ncbi:MAG: hypothetical protein AAGG45_10390 [Pseudomonadota bacterium]